MCYNGNKKRFLQKSYRLSENKSRKSNSLQFFKLRSFVSTINLILFAQTIHQIIKCFSTICFVGSLDELLDQIPQKQLLEYSKRELLETVGIDKIVFDSSLQFFFLILILFVACFFFSLCNVFVLISLTFFSPLPLLLNIFGEFIIFELEFKNQRFYLRYTSYLGRHVQLPQPHLPKCSH